MRSRSWTRWIAIVLLGSVSAAGQSTSASVATGFPENGVFEGSAFDSIQMNNGNLHIQIPFATIQGRHRAYHYVYSYDNRGWGFRTATAPNGYQVQTPAPEPFNGMQFRPPDPIEDFSVTQTRSETQVQCGTDIFGDPVYGVTITNHVVIEKDGTKHGFAPDYVVYGSQCPPIQPFRAYATDGSGWAVDIGSDGTIARAMKKNGDPKGFDTNGNALASEIPSPPQFVGVPNTSSSQFLYYDSNGNQQAILVSRVAVPVKTQLCQFGIHCSTEFNSNFSQPSVIQLPDNLSYQFTYEQNQYGEPNSVTLPTGAKISWAWGNLDQGGRKVTSRTVTVNGNQYTWTYSWGAPSFTSTWQNTVVDPLGNKTVYTCTSVQGSFDQDPYPACGITQAQYYQIQGDGSLHLVKTVNTDYNLNVTGAVVPVRETTTWNDSNLVSKVETDWDTIPWQREVITWKNPIERREYDFGIGSPGNLLRRTDYDYAHINSNSTYQPYKDANIADLDLSEIVYDGAGNMVSKTINTYDDTALLSTASTPATGHDYTNFGISNTVRGNLTSISRWRNTDGAMLKTINQYDDLGNLRTSTDPNGNITTYSYADKWSNTNCLPSGFNGQALPTQVTNALGQNSSIVYFPCTALRQAVLDQNDINSNRAGTTYTYDLMARPLAINSSDGGQTSFCYSDISGAPCGNSGDPLEVVATKKIASNINLVTTTVTDGLGRKVQTQLNSDPAGTVYVDTTYDPLGRVASVSNPYRSTGDSTYGITQYAYDFLGRVIQTTKQDGSVTLVKYDLQTGNADCTLATDETGKPRYACSDALGRLVEVQEPSAGSVFTPGWSRVLQQWGAPGDVPVPGDYDGDGITDFAIWRPSTGTWWVMRSSDGTIVTQQWGNQASGDVPVPGDYDGDGKTDYAIWRASTGTFWILRSSDGGTTTQQWGNQASGDVPVPGDYDGDRKTDFAVWRASTGTWYVLRSSDGGTTSQQWGNQSSGDTPVPGDYDGDKKTDFAVWRSSTGGWYVLRSSDGGTTTQSWGTSGDKPAQGDYDGDGKTDFAVWRPSTATWYLIRSSDGHQVSEQWGTNGDMPVAASFQGGGQADFAVWNPTTGMWSVSLSYTTLYSYDALGNLTQVNQEGDGSQGSRVRTFTYDSLSRLLTANNPESGTISYSYDANGNLLQKTSPAPNQTQSTVTQTISYCYDKLNRVTGKQYAAASCPLNSPAVQYFYDQSSYQGLTIANGVGRLTGLSDQAGNGTYSFDALGRIATEQRAIAGIKKSINYSYYLDGSIQTLTYPSGAVVTYTPDAAGHILSAVDNGNNIQYVTSATYGPDSSLTSFVSGYSSNFSGIANSFTYNKRLQPLNISAIAPNNQTVFSIGYDFHLGNGDNGNVYAITNSRDPSRSQTFTYDALNRLASAQNAGTDCTRTTLNGKTEYWGNSYSYDAWGNLTKKLPSKCSAENLNEYADWTNRLHTFSGLDNWYDAAGNVTLDATTGLSYSYDAENRITGAGGYAYTYDSDGNRVKKSNGSTGTIYWYMSPGIVGESDLNGNPQSEYVFFGGERVARKDFPSNAVSYYFSDDLKTASLITDSTGTIKEDEDYYPWGGELQFVNNDSNHYKFTGKERDAETGLDYFGARYYGNWTGRFLSADSKRVALRHLLNPQKLNKYAYVLDNPLSEVDPDGLEDIKVFVHFNPGDTMPQNQPNWGKIQETARAHGNTVTVYQDDNNATAANYQSSLAAGGTTVFIGHTQSVDNGPAYGGEHVVAVSLADKEVGRPSTDPNLMGAGRVVDNGVIGSLGTVVPGELPANVNGGTVAIFGCDSTGLASQYSGANNYVSVDSGADKFTSTDGLLSAGGAFVNDLAQGKSLNTAVSDANKNLDKNPKTDIGDKVVKEQQQ